MDPTVFNPRRLVPVVVALLALTGASLTPAEAAKGSLPSARKWKADVATVMTGSRAWLTDRVAAEQRRDRPRRLAINFVIDNSAIASKYLQGKATPRVYGFAMHAHRQGVALLFNTARVGKQLKKARRLLVKAGYVVDGLCGRSSTRIPLVKGKQHCRTKFAADGYVLIGNVGNRPTDFRGGGYERAFRLPNYKMRLP